MLVKDDGVRSIPQRELTSGADRPIHFLEIQEIVLAHRTHRLEEGAADHHGAAGDVVELGFYDLAGRRRDGRGSVADVIAARATRVEPRAAEALRLGGTIVKSHRRAAKADGVGLGHAVLEGRERGRLHDRVGIQKPEPVVPPGEPVSKTDVVPAGEAEVPARGDQREPGAGRGRDGGGDIRIASDGDRLHADRGGSDAVPGGGGRVDRSFPPRPGFDVLERPVRGRVVAKDDIARAGRPPERLKTLEAIRPPVPVEQHDKGAGGVF